VHMSWPGAHACLQSGRFRTHGEAFTCIWGQYPVIGILYVQHNMQPTVPEPYKHTYSCNR
jgi:hypothetical protein